MKKKNRIELENGRRSETAGLAGRHPVFVTKRKRVWESGMRFEEGTLAVHSHAQLITVNEGLATPAWLLLVLC